MRNHTNGLSFRKTWHRLTHTARLQLYPLQVSALSRHKAPVWANIQTLRPKTSRLLHHLVRSKYQTSADSAFQPQAHQMHQVPYRVLHHLWQIDVRRLSDLHPGQPPFPIVAQVHRRHQLLVIYHAEHFYFWSGILTWFVEFFINCTIIALHTNGSIRPPRSLWPLSSIWSAPILNPPRVANRDNGTARAWRWRTANIYASTGKEHAWCCKRVLCRKRRKSALSRSTYPPSLR